MATPDAVAAFRRITGAPEFVAVQKLEEYGGNLNEAINSHFLEGDRHILSGQGVNIAAAPQYNSINQHRGGGSNGIMSFLSAARRFRPSLLVDSNYRRELSDLYQGIGGAIEYTNRPPPLTSHPGEVREVPAWINSVFEPHYQSGLSTTGEDLSSHGLGIRGADGYQNQYPLAQSNASHVPNTEIEEAMLQAAIEASKIESRGGSSRERIDVLNHSSDGGLPQSLVQQEDDDLARAIASSLETAEHENATRELLVEEETEGRLGVHDLLDEGKKTDSCGNKLEWGGISSEEINEALVVETALFGEISNHRSQNFSSLPNLQHHPKQNMDPKTQCISTSMSQSLIDSRLLKQQQDADYLASLRADKLKELDSLNKTESHSKQEEPSKKMIEKKELVETLDKKELKLSKEPELSDEVITIVVRMPDGGRHERRFLKTDKLELLFYFIDICGSQKPGTYRFVKSYPRRAYSINDSSSTFNEVGLGKNNEALFLELI
ncbi:unnamed protein product [Sphenostylis stenocarpa]|uniref:UBX domain-containing protein n=1 Tax=Sphenostylis stenocarpa TaxID=92480 RepID=A0AA86T3V1_9FABA|nr:unnamed protein product [Sphenostylis stenocarpa]